MVRNTGIVYDGRMCRHAHPKQMHPEQPLRIERIFKSIVKVFGPLGSATATPSTKEKEEENNSNDNNNNDNSFDLLTRFNAVALDDGINFDSSDEELESADAEKKEDEIIDINPHPFPDLVRLTNDPGLTLLGEERSSPVQLTRGLVEIPIRRVTFDELALCHDAAYLRQIQDYPDLELEELCDIALRFNSIYLCKESLDCALLSCGGVIEAINHVIQPEQPVDNAFAIVRPPGHHAESHCAM